MTELFRIKPLEWEWFETSDIRGWSVSLCGFSAMVYQQIDYDASHHMASPIWTGWTIDATSHQTADCASPEEGKQLAEQHWRAYIKQALEPHGSCLWKYDPDGYWKTGCGNAFVISNEEDLITNGFHFCHACGKRIEERPLEPVETEQ